MSARKLHRALAWAAAVVAAVWALSGAFHPLITAIGPKPVAFAAPDSRFEAGAFPAPATLLAAQGIDRASALRYVGIGIGPDADSGRATLQVLVPGDGARRYFDARSGAEIADADRDRAIALARHYTGLADRAVISAEVRTTFDRDYPWINRLLPVWAVRFAGDDAVIAFVDTGGDRLGTMSDGSKRYWQRWFQTAHTLTFIDAPGLRRLAVGGLVSVLLATALLGLTLLLRRGGRQPARRWHRRLAWVAVLPALLFPATGLLKLVSATVGVPEPPLPPVLDLSRLTAVPFLAEDGAIREAVAVPVAGADPVWRVVAPRADTLNLWLTEADGRPIAGDDATLARRLAAGLRGDAAATGPEPVLVAGFDRDYGFANKRLPVWRLASPDADGERWYFETRSGAVAAITGGPARALEATQGLLFNLLHKGHFLDPLGVTPNQRNVVMSGLAVSLIVAAVLGLRLRRRRPVALAEAGR